MPKSNTPEATLRFELYVLRETGQVARLTRCNEDGTQEDVSLRLPLYVTGLVGPDLS